MICKESGLSDTEQIHQRECQMGEEDQVYNGQNIFTWLLSLVRSFTAVVFTKMDKEDSNSAPKNSGFNNVEASAITACSGWSSPTKAAFGFHSVLWYCTQSTCLSSAVFNHVESYVAVFTSIDSLTVKLMQMTTN